MNDLRSQLKEQVRSWFAADPAREVELRDLARVLTGLSVMSLYTWVVVKILDYLSR